MLYKENPELFDKIVADSQKFVNYNYARSKFEDKLEREAVINNLVAYIIQDIEAHYDLVRKK